MAGLSANILIPLIFVVIGLVLIYVYFRSLAQVRASEGWSAAQGTVVESWVRRSDTTDNDGSVSSSFYPEVRYQYQVMGSEFQGEKITFGPKGGGNHYAAEKVIAKYPSGASVKVYYQPDKPGNAVLERSVSGMLLVFGILFVAAGIFFYVRWG
jgi:hypothetical protein